jgi:hypothetical protein
MSAYKTQTPGNYPEEIIQHLEHGESLKNCGWAPGPVWMFWRREKSLASAGIRTPDRPVSNLEFLYLGDSNSEMSYYYPSIL